MARLTLFEKPEDYEAFLRVWRALGRNSPADLRDGRDAEPLAFVVRPDSDEQVSAFFRRLTVTHTMRWHAHYRTGGTGHSYQGRFKSFPVQSDEHLLTVLRYVERNPVRAGLAERAELWRWGSAWARGQRSSARPRWLTQPTEPALPRLAEPGSTSRKPRPS